MVDSRSDVVLRIGAGITVLGLVFTLIAITPLFVPSVQLPGVLWFLSMLTGVGIIVICAGLVMSARSRRTR